MPNYQYEMFSMNTGVLAHKLKKHTHCEDFILRQIYYFTSIQSHMKSPITTDHRFRSTGRADHSMNDGIISSGHKTKCFGPEEVVLKLKQPPSPLPTYQRLEYVNIIIHVNTMIFIVQVGYGGRIMMTIYVHMRSHTLIDVKLLIRNIFNEYGLLST